MGACLSQEEQCQPFPKAIQHAKGLPIEKAYKFNKKIGGGAFGAVWLAHRIDYPKYKFAIKKINKKEVGNNELDLLRREIDVLREVDHPNIIKFYDTYEDQQHIYIVMEYCSGGELFAKITNSGCIHETEAKIYMYKIIMAVSHLHGLKIVHRDLKTENFLFDSNCATKELKLVDFGLSNKFGKNFENLHSQVGTIYYVAPEVLKGCYDEKCDLWSLGVIMFTMLCGDLPFYDVSLAEVYKKLNSGAFQYSKPIWNGVSVAAKDLINKLLTVDPEARLSASEALKHEWFDNLRSNSVHMTHSLIESIKTFTDQKNLFQREALRMVVKHIPDENLESIKSLFYKLDTFGHGFVMKSDLEQVLMKEQDLDEKIIKEMTACMGLQGNGAIFYSDFISAAVHAKKELLEEAIWITFKELDMENSGELTEESIRKSIEGLCRGISQEQMQMIVESLRIYGSSITYDKFKDIVLGQTDNR